MKIFIDTNILLDIYHLSSTDLEELRKILKLVEVGKIELLVSRQVIDEFWRNREGVIADAIKVFKESGAKSKVPNIIRGYAGAEELRKLVVETNAKVKELLAEAEKDIESSTLKADEVVNELFDKVTVGKIDDAIFDRAHKRVEIGNPPGKRGSLGDAINWEWILEQEIEFWDENLTIISGDGDFESVLNKGEIKEYLKREWEIKNPLTELRLDKTLTGFLKREFPEVQLAEQVDKLAALEMFEQSGTFATTHVAVAKLSQFDDFTDGETARILQAYHSNRQIYLIISDADVEEFARKIVIFAKQESTKELADKLTDILQEKEPDLNDIPF